MLEQTKRPAKTKVTIKHLANYCNGMRKVYNCRKHQLPLFIFPPWNGFIWEDEVNQNRWKLQITVEYTLNKWFLKYYGSWNQAELEKLMANCGEVLSTVTECGKLSLRFSFPPVYKESSEETPEEENQKKDAQDRNAKMCKNMSTKIYLNAEPQHPSETAMHWLYNKCGMGMTAFPQKAFQVKFV